MFNFLNKAVGLFHTKPSVSYLQPKTINVYFRNAINPKYILLNISHYDYFELEVVASQLNNNNVFVLVANLHGELDTQLDLGVFETRVEAEKALLVLRNKLFGLDKKLVKFTSIFLVLTILIGLFGNAFDGVLRKMPANTNNGMPISQNNNIQPNNNFALPPNVTAQDMATMQKTLDNTVETAKQRTNNADFTGQVLVNPVQQTPTAAAPVEPAPEVSGNPEVNNLLNNLGK